MDIKTLMLSINNIENIIKFIDNYEHKNNLTTDMFLLNLKNKNNYSYIENIVYEIAKLQLNMKNEEIDEENDYIEFWWRNDANINFYHIDCDEKYREKYKKYKTPYISNILYLNKTNIPTIIFPIEPKAYMYKKFDIDELFLSFPDIGKLISFEKSYMHAIISENENPNINRPCLMVNIWKNYKPLNVPFFENNEEIMNNTCNINSILPFPTQKFINYENDIRLTDDMINDILYNYHYKSLEKIYDIINNSNIGENIKIKIDNKRKINKNFKNKYHIVGDIYKKDECEWLKNIENINDTVLSYIQYTIQDRILKHITETHDNIKEIHFMDAFKNYHHSEHDLCVIICIDNFEITLDELKKEMKKGDVIYYFNTIFTKNVLIEENNNYICLLFKIYN